MGIMLKEITKCYKIGEETVAALAGISLTIETGEFVAIMGPSGSGKSTMMNILGCLDRPSSGSYLLADQEVATMNDDELAKTRNKRIGFVFQNFNLLSRVSAWENVALPLVYARVAEKERLNRAAAILDSVGLSARKQHMPNELSGGQRQRVAIARALINDPSIIMADEPTGNLDSRSSVDIMRIFGNLNEQGKTIILVTHEPDIAQYAKRVITVRDGLILSDEIKEQSAC
ncbi:putative ABC transporter ATP-binding protein YknY [Sporomusa silvacetica DSM 10669]|uniref:ABC transporter ATP-binding protein YknY n=1 Tax=Sporomusa silvacetica DSM 10669 TaxID=1123289 RepID=A0ABZ3IG54_9FIRM|nr:ABC transporter ATP-binding protein [Sporomusa silvacetica]OZC16510.1 macrolide export ATP-binding/permease protein MacB [Sporomusa silvacetica DSM 10669]